MKQQNTVRAAKAQEIQSCADGRFPARLLRLKRLGGILVTLLLFGVSASHGRVPVLPTNVTLYAAAFGGGAFVSVGSDGVIFSSVTNGPWEQRISGTTNRLEAVAFGGGLFVAAGKDGTLLSSPDGVTWTVRSVVATQTLPKAAYGNGRFVIGGQGGPGQWIMLVSSNAINWTTVTVEAPGPDTVPDGLPLGAFAFGAGKFLAAGGVPGGAKQFMASTDGITWVEQGALGTSGTSVSYKSMFFGNGAFGIVERSYTVDDDDSGYYDRLLLSPDGLNWRQSGYSSFDWKSAAAGDCTFVLAAGDPTASYYPFLVTTRGYANYWSITNEPRLAAVNALAFGDGRFFAFGSDIAEVVVPQVPALITVSPSNDTRFVGPNGSISFSIDGTCLAPPVVFQWRRNGVNIPGATSEYLYLPSLSTNDTGQYTVVASNSLGQTENSTAGQLTVIPPANGPPIISYPLGIYTNTTLMGNDTYIGAYLSSGWPTPTLQWRFNGTNLPGATNADLTLVNVGPAAEGAYSVVASNAFGTAVSGDIVLRLEPNPPVIFSYVENFTVPEHARFEFLPQYYYFYSYGLAGTYLRVFKDDSPNDLPLSELGQIVLQRVTPADAGQYRLVVSNPFGTATVLVANVTVTPAEPLDRWVQRNPLPGNDNLFDTSYGNGVFVGVGANGRTVWSTNGFDWLASSTKGEAPLTGVAFGNGTFVAVGGVNIFTSTDGRNWTLRIARFDLQLRSVTFANGRFVAASYDAILTSPDGITWTDATMPFANRRDLRDVTYGQGTFVAVGDHRSVAGGWRSANGTDWLPSGAPPREELEAVTFGNGLFVAVGDDGEIHTSPGGVNWTGRDSTIGTRLLGVDYGAGRFVAVGARGRILSSPGGVNWTRETSGTPDRLESVRFLNNLFVAVGENGTILTSPNGTTWTRRSQGTVRDLDGMTHGNGMIVAVGKGGTILTSTNGAHYVQQSSGVTNDLHGVGYSNGLFVAVGEPEIILTSSNAVQWQTRHSGGVSSLKNVRRGASGWVAVGTQGRILTSTDGASWVGQTSPTANDLNDVVYGDGVYVVVGDNLPPNGTMLTSPDGVNWTRRPQFIGKNLRSVAHARGTFIATANDQMFLSSTNILQWERRVIPQGMANVYRVPDNLRSATFAANHWILVGNSGTVLTSTNLLDWKRRSTPTRENLHGVVWLSGQLAVIGNRGTILQSASFASAPMLLGRMMQNGFQIQVTGEPGAVYALQSVDGLPGAWTTLQTIALQQATTNLLDTAAASNPRRFYRVIVP